MKTLTRCLSAVLFAALLSGPAAHLHAQATNELSVFAEKSPRQEGGEHMDEPETNSDIEQYRHSSTVNAIARIAHVKTETAAQIFEDLNSGVLILAIAIFLWKMVPKMLRKRSETLEKELVQARLATDDANRRLAEVEARLLRLDSEIDAIRHQVEQEAVSDEQRIHAALETERERIVAPPSRKSGQCRPRPSAI